MRLNSEQNDDECLSSSLHPNESVTITIYDDGDDEQIDFEPKKHRALIHYLFGGLLLFAFIFGILSFWNAHSKSKLNDDVERNLLMDYGAIPDVAEGNQVDPAMPDWAHRGCCGFLPARLGLPQCNCWEREDCCTAKQRRRFMVAAGGLGAGSFVAGEIGSLKYGPPNHGHLEIVLLSVVAMMIGSVMMILAMRYLSKK